MRKFIIKKEQLVEYIERKKADKIYYNIMVDLHSNMKNLNENVSLKNINQDVINNYKRKNLITSRVYELLINNKIISKNYEIL